MPPHLIIIPVFKIIKKHDAASRGHSEIQKPHRTLTEAALSPSKSFSSQKVTSTSPRTTKRIFLHTVSHRGELFSLVSIIGIMPPRMTQINGEEATVSSKTRRRGMTMPRQPSVGVSILGRVRSRGALFHPSRPQNVHCALH